MCIRDRVGEVPVVVVRLVEEVEAIEAFHPAYFDFDVEVFGVGRGVLVLVVVHVGQGDGVAVGHNRPVVVLAVDAGNAVGGELELSLIHI